MKEKKFLAPYADVVSFNDDDIIRTSGEDGQIAVIPIGSIPIED